jgi:hypothetical protein
LFEQKLNLGQERDMRIKKEILEHDLVVLDKKNGTEDKFLNKVK